MPKGKLNLDIANAVTELETAMKRVLPKNIMWRVVLGRGLEFDGYRDYMPSEDAVNIDWKATVRSGKTLVRKYIEERDLKFLFIIDISNTMIFGSTEKLKCEYCAELSAALFHLILMSGDRAGFVLFNDNLVRAVMPTMGKRHFEMFVYEVSNSENYGGVSDLNNVLDIITQSIDKSTSMVFLISDFIKVNELHKRNLELLSGMIESVAIIVRDPLDKELPLINKEIVISDPYSGDKLLINPKIAGNEYKKNSLEQLDMVKNIFRDFNIDFLELYTDQHFVGGVVEFFMNRIKSGRKVKLKGFY